MTRAEAEKNEAIIKYKSLSHKGRMKFLAKMRFEYRENAKGMKLLKKAGILKPIRFLSKRNQYLWKKICMLEEAWFE